MFTGGTVVRIRLRPWRLWALGSKIIFGVLMFAIPVAVVAYFADQRDTGSTGAALKVISAGTALAALFVAAYTAYSAAVRGKKKDTLEAWSKWSDDSHVARAEVSRVFGLEEITVEQAKALAGEFEMKDKDGRGLTVEKRQEMRRYVAQDILNGLERLAVGVELGIYDEKVLRLLGATIIARTWERFEPYVREKREQGPDKKRQSKAYTELHVLYQIMEEPRLIQTLRGSRKSVDTARLKALRNR